MKAWITKYALTQGIYSVEGEVHPTIGDGRMFCREGRNGDIFHKPHWHETEADAIAHAKDMRYQKIASLQKQLARIENLTFGEGK